MFWIELNGIYIIVVVVIINYVVLKLIVGCRLLLNLERDDGCSFFVWIVCLIVYCDGWLSIMFLIYFGYVGDL